MSLFSSFSRKTSPRCEHLSPTGRQCSQPACSSHPTLCFVHKPKSESVEHEKPHRTPAADAAFLAEINQVCGDLETPEQVRRALSLTLKAFVSRQISRETAGTTTYILQMLLRSLREIAYHKKLEREAAAKLEKENNVIDWGVPRPDRSDCGPLPNIPVPLRGPITPEDILRKEAELKQRKDLAAEEAAALSVAQASACVPTECGSSATAFPPQVQSTNPPSTSAFPSSLPSKPSSISASSLTPQAPPYDHEEQRWRAMTRGAIFRQR